MDTPTPETQVLLRRGEGGYSGYRIPAALRTPAGTIMLFVEGRLDNMSDFGQIDLLVLRSTDDGSTWDTPVVVHADASEPSTTIGNPAPVHDARTGKTRVLFTRNNERVFTVASSNGGLTWDAPVDISDAVTPAGWFRYWTGPGHGIQLAHGAQAGRLLIPSYHMAAVKGRTMMRSHSVYSDDGGTTWTTGNPTVLGATIDVDATHDAKDWVPGRDYYWAGCESLTAELPDGRLYLTARNQVRLGDRKAFAYSDDGGHAWTPLQFASDLPGVQVQSSVVFCPGAGETEDLLLWSGLMRGGATGSDRRDLAVYASTNGGQTFPRSTIIQRGPAAYSDMVPMPDESVLIFFEAGDEHAYEGIRMARVEVASLVAAQP